MSALSPIDARSFAPRPWLVPLVVCLAGAAWLAHERPGAGLGLPVGVTLALTLPALALSTAAPKLRSASHSAIISAVPLAPALISAPALLATGEDEAVRLWARVDHLIALGTVLSAAPVALRRTADRGRAALSAVIGAVAMGACAPDHLSWGVGGVLVALGASAPLLLRNPALTPPQPPGVGLVRPARGGGFEASPPARAMLELPSAGALHADQLVAAADPRDRPALRAALQAAAEGEGVTLEVRVPTATGGVRVVLVDGGPDALELRTLESAAPSAAQTDAHAAQAAALCGIGLMHLSRDGSVIDTNAVLQRMTAPFAGPMGWLQRVEVVREQSQRTPPGPLSGGPTTAEQIELALPQGAGRRVFMVRRCPLEDGGALVTAEDLTARLDDEQARRQVDARTRAELELLRSRQVNSQALLAGINHEMRTPINIIKGFTELLLDDAVDDAAKEDLVRIAASARRLQRLVEDATRLNTDVPELSHEVFDLEAVLDEASQSVQSRMQEKRNSLRVTYPAQPVAMVGDRASFVQVLERLLDNAAQFTTQGAVQLSADRGDGDNVEVLIRDNGAGMSADQFALLEQPFWQRATPTVGADAALGLGLSVVKSLVARMGGTLQVSSGGDRGTIVHISLPREARGRQAEAWLAQAGPDSGEDPEISLVGRNRSVLLPPSAEPLVPTLASAAAQRKASG